MCMCGPCGMNESMVKLKELRVTLVVVHTDTANVNPQYHLNSNHISSIKTIRDENITLPSSGTTKNFYSMRLPNPSSRISFAF